MAQPLPSPPVFGTAEDVTKFVSETEISLIDAEGGVVTDAWGGPTLNISSGGSGVPVSFSSTDHDHGAALTFSLFCALWELSHKPVEMGGLGRAPRIVSNAGQADILMGMNISHMARSIASLGTHISGRPERRQMLAELEPPFIFDRHGAVAEELEQLVIAYKESKGDAWDGTIPQGDGTNANRLQRLWTLANKHGNVVSGRPELKERLLKMGVKPGKWSAYA